ncbi:uncharacterized protein EV420DRAFT_1482367 [Desarmillaria tabescens]|uniref:Uncharacterized protein n=1 Tax=Armillaria tabescens TaxID=1929756 RepID=A0AA39MZQ1_ARMTA|nr:uncharacterized protein EV420DRAFT_1482367 [Desarmillaria tabescens]KAK0452029.1 hypothetical protein EV420DRAFT_1482367 [Desarmillaria tabescens]
MVDHDAFPLLVSNLRENAPQAEFSIFPGDLAVILGQKQEPGTHPRHINGSAMIWVPHQSTAEERERTLDIRNYGRTDTVNVETSGYSAWGVPKASALCPRVDQDTAGKIKGFRNGCHRTWICTSNLDVVMPATEDLTLAPPSLHRGMIFDFTPSRDLRSPTYAMTIPPAGCLDAFGSAIFVPSQSRLTNPTVWQYLFDILSSEENKMELVMLVWDPGWWKVQETTRWG